MTSKIEFKDIVLFGVLTVLIIIVFYYFYRKNASTQAKLTQLHNLLNYQQTLIGQSNQSNNAINHEIKMLKNLFKTKENVKNIELPNVSAKEYNLDSELKDELKELDNNIAEEEEELADETELQEQKEFEKSVEVENKKDDVEEVENKKDDVEEVETGKEENVVVKEDAEPKNEHEEAKKEEVIEDKIIEVDEKEPTDISIID